MNRENEGLEAVLDSYWPKSPNVRHGRTCIWLICTNSLGGALFQKHNKT